MSRVVAAPFSFVGRIVPEDDAEPVQLTVTPPAPPTRKDPTMTTDEQKILGTLGIRPDEMTKFQGDERQSAALAATGETLTEDERRMAALTGTSPQDMREWKRTGIVPRPVG